MAESFRSTRAVRFGAFTADLRTGEVHKDGRKVKLQEKPFQILAALVECPGEVVTRQELRERLWPADTFVDFDHSLKTAVSKVREALGDSAEHPRFIETLARRGYRFIAPVETAGPLRPGGRSQGGRIMLAVLPFENLSGDPTEDYFSDGMTEEMIAQLGSLCPTRLGVIARTSSMKYKRSGKGIDQIGRELNVHYVLEGSVRRAGTRVRITAQLVQVCDQAQLWGASYERDLGDILKLQSQVAQAIAQEIRVKLPADEEIRLAGTRLIRPEAYVSYLKGRHYCNTRTVAGILKAISCFRQAIEKDPAHALAHSGLADAYRVLAVFGLMPPRKAMPQANAAALKALEIDSQRAEAHTSLAGVRFRFDWDWAGSEIEFKRALELNPSYAEAHRTYAIYLQAMGQLDEAIATTQRAQQLDPLSLLMKTAAGWAYYFGRHYDRAIEHFREALELDADFLPALHNLGRAYAQKGMRREAIAALERAADLSGREVLHLSALGYAYARVGDGKSTHGLLNELHTLAKQRYVSPYDVATVYAGLGDKDRSLEWLGKAHKAHSSRLVLLNTDPVLDGLRSDPRFKELLKLMGLIPADSSRGADLRSVPHLSPVQSDRPPVTQ